MNPSNCPKCGKPIPVAHNQCSHCGHRIKYFADYIADLLVYSVIWVGGVSGFVFILNNYLHNNLAANDKVISWIYLIIIPIFTVWLTLGWNKNKKEPLSKSAFEFMRKDIDKDSSRFKTRLLVFQTLWNYFPYIFLIGLVIYLIAAVPGMTLVKWSAIIMVPGGAILFFLGLRRLKFKKILEDIPESNISSGAVGSHVQVFGEVYCSPDSLVKSPISGQPCACFYLQIFKGKSDINPNSEQFTFPLSRVGKISSRPSFLIRDMKGNLAKVEMKDANIRYLGHFNDYEINSDVMMTMPKTLQDCLEKHMEQLKNIKLGSTGLFFSQRYFFREWALFPGDEVFVFGYADSGTRENSTKKMKLADYLFKRKKIESDPDLFSRFDINKDGVLSQDELEIGIEVLNLQNQSKEKSVENIKPSLKLVFRKKPGHSLLIFRNTKPEIIQKMLWQSWIGILLGSGTSIASIAYLFIA